MKILAVIPARGGSKGIPNKNLEKINGISLVGIAVKMHWMQIALQKCMFQLIVNLLNLKL